MSYRRKSLEELDNILRTYKQGFVERFGEQDERLIEYLDESIALKKKEYFDAIFNTMHPSDMIKVKELILRPKIEIPKVETPKRGRPRKDG